MDIQRGYYNEIKFDSLDAEMATAIRELVKSAGTRTDEHGSWDFAAEFDRKGRGEAINWDLYACGNDIHDGRLLAVIQVRQYRKQHKNWYPSIRKNYFLIGTNEDGSAFSHPVESTVIHAAIRKGNDPILAVQKWIFGCDYARVIRQGDIALIPLAKACGEPTEETEALIENSHRLTAAEIRRNGHLYAKDPIVVHEPGTHSQVQGRGWFRIQTGARATYWKFARPSKD